MQEPVFVWDRAPPSTKPQDILEILGGHGPFAPHAWPTSGVTCRKYENRCLSSSQITVKIVGERVATPKNMW